MVSLLLTFIKLILILWLPIKVSLVVNFKISTTYLSNCVAVFYCLRIVSCAETEKTGLAMKSCSLTYQVVRLSPEL